MTQTSPRQFSRSAKRRYNTKISLFQRQSRCSLFSIFKGHIQNPMVELVGFEPTTSWMQARRSPTRATAPYYLKSRPLFQICSNSALESFEHPLAGGGGEARTLAPVARPSSLANCPLHLLGYSSIYGRWFEIVLRRLSFPPRDALFLR